MVHEGVRPEREVKRQSQDEQPDQTHGPAERTTREARKERQKTKQNMRRQRDRTA